MQKSKLQFLSDKVIDLIVGLTPKDFVIIHPDGKRQEMTEFFMDDIQFTSFDVDQNRFLCNFERTNYCSDYRIGCEHTNDEDIFYDYPNDFEIDFANGSLCHYTFEEILNNLANNPLFIEVFPFQTDVALEWNVEDYRYFFLEKQYGKRISHVVCIKKGNKTKTPWKKACFRLSVYSLDGQFNVYNDTHHSLIPSEQIVFSSDINGYNLLISLDKEYQKVAKRLKDIIKEKQAFLKDVQSQRLKLNGLTGKKQKGVEINTILANLAKLKISCL